ncbi:competence/damage-inducible protein cinA [Natranaerovirga pectinivora]|uniref:Putative competence-damage inducible protein n=1 Tax=Natranaerovirga pectinivora TaxID=682400 RepID=A0A4R3MPW8_9FIRM|nr:competence/damage-inducible protein A [Natranaerovirga pectinivora]TCT15032.1 competence/damage-inducible protein cinA [Natranaerovirga pectinivora]
MIAEIISVGTELLLGNILNSNAKYLSEECSELGLSVFFQTVVGDNEKRLEETIKRALQGSDIVFLTGGLGPTQDDLTKEVVAKVVDKPLVKDEYTEKKLIDFFNKRKVKMASNNLKQALIPEGSLVLENNNGTAPGLIVNEDNKILVLLPGPPKEMVPLFEEQVKPYIRKISSETIASKTLRVVGIGESTVEELLTELINGQSNPTIAPYAKDGEVHLRLTAKALSEKEAYELIEPTEKAVYDILGDSIYTNEDKTLEEVVLDLLLEKEYTLSIVESCTGGLLSGRIINCSGISTVYKEGQITYSNEAKVNLGVKEETINQYGAVSGHTAKEMVEAMAKVSGSEVSLSVTGIAGPTGGTEDKPVGLVYIGCYINGKTTVKEYNFVGSRERIRNNSVIAAINLLRLELLNN